MPRIDDALLDSVVYFYESVEDARQGRKSGGCGFLVGVPVEGNDNKMFPFVVTNSHVIKEGKSTVIRLKKKTGESHVQETDISGWTHHPNGDDVAASHIALTDELAADFRFHWISSAKFVTREVIEEYNIGPGDEIFMVGRFIQHDGKQTNLPVVRFGYLSMLPNQPILHPRGLLQESFLVEMFSIGGFSGSPVFVYFRPFSIRPGPGKPPVTTVQTNTQIREHNIGPLLLGINWGHINNALPVIDSSGKRLDPPQFVHSNTMMAGVVPAWKIWELLGGYEFLKTGEQV